MYSVVETFNGAVHAVDSFDNMNDAYMHACNLILMRYGPAPANVKQDISQYIHIGNYANAIINWNAYAMLNLCAEYQIIQNSTHNAQINPPQILLPPPQTPIPQQHTFPISNGFNSLNGPSGKIETIRLNFKTQKISYGATCIKCGEKNEYAEAKKDFCCHKCKIGW